ncbi:deoxyribodipyrimidine photo-lyase [Lepidopterella palustris CBS 459.81]|uniref:Deoxyribodipyrimidine photo-lyase n=1 Tax=Lepidopterella palustris CBS 459.81 TaxID=1314670 RepID=A0A8E2J9H5_9PEZI|nr:deoxyribodipyrimidine photo-lyase [Lepidopterella palustris CBS 459.81]
MPPKRKLRVSSAYSSPPGSKSKKRSTKFQPAPVSTPSTLSTNTFPPRNSSSSSNSTLSHSSVNSNIINRTFYPPEMSNARCALYNSNQLPRPMAELEQTLFSTLPQRQAINLGAAVIHWFKRDLRLHDNRSLHLAAQKAREGNIPLICVFLISPQDYEAHLTSPARVDFEFRSLAILRQGLAALDIPLHISTVEIRKNVPARLVEFATQVSAHHIFTNLEYEPDELRREDKLVRLCLDHGIAFDAVHDDCIVPPTTLSTRQGKQYSVYTPWFRAWVAHLHSHPDLLAASPPPPQNPPSTRRELASLFDADIPAVPENKTLSPEMKKRSEHLWPAGEHAALERLQRFLSEKVKAYKDRRNFPAENGTACLSVHHSAGTLAARTSVRMAREANSTSKLDGGGEGLKGWIGEVAWRDFYKHVLVNWPYVCMNKPFKYEYTNIEWEYNDEHFKAWCEGRTGYPFVDAAMRQLLHTGYMHNRCRMLVASFLSKHLLLDWRLGEQYFMLHLIDGDFASNNGGWGFSSSTGVDPQPYFRIFNPLLQSEKFDPEGEYIRKWVPELRDVVGKVVHDPFGRGDEEIVARVEGRGYPRMVVEHRWARERCLKRYKAGIGRETA